MTTSQKPQATPPAKTGTAPATAAAKAPETSAAKVQALAADIAKRKAERAAKFLELARPRLARALKVMRQLENLGRGQYEYTPEQANKLLQHLTDGVGRVKVAFAPKVRGSRAAQELPEL